MGISYQNKPLPEPFVVYIPNFNFQRYLEYATEDIDCELLNGVLVIHSPASLEHELIFKCLLSLVDYYIQKKQLGIVVGSRFTMKLSEIWAPEPDLIYVEKALESNLKATYLDGPATVVFEILSPSTREDDLLKKIPAFIEYGVKEVWIIDPEKKEIKIQWKSDALVSVAQEWMASKFIPGFRIKPEWMWKVKDLIIADIVHELL